MSSRPVPAHVRTRPLVARLWRATGTTMRRHLEDAGYGSLRPAHLAVLSRTGGDGMRVTEIAAEVGTSKMAVGQLVDQLEALGYVERRPDPEDGRAKRVVRTATGTAATAALAAAADGVEDRWREVLGPKRLAALREDLLALVMAAEADRDGGGWA